MLPLFCYYKKVLYENFCFDLIGEDMPGYILHLTQAELVCRALKEQGIQLTDTWMNRFFLGALLPDTLRKTEKIKSHFWNPSDLDRLAIPPDLELFMAKYGERITGPVMQGYRMHLQLDAWYVQQFWDQILEFHDGQGHLAYLKKDIESVWLKVYKREISVADFFSSEYYYGDYSRMNGYLLKKYQLTIPVYEEGLDCPVEEVEPAGLRKVLRELQTLQSQSEVLGRQQLKVFRMDALEKFIAEKAAEAAREIGEEMLFRKKPIQKKEYDHETLRPVLKCSICNGEQVAGFKDIRTGSFQEVCLIRTAEDLQRFKDTYGLDQVPKEY